jgi:thiamine biosynthesis lipoprotein
VRDTSGIARKLAALERLGLRRAAPPPFDHSLRLDRHSWRVSSGRAALGSFVDLTVIDRSETRAPEAVALAFAELERLRVLFDRRDAGSALAALNAAGTLGAAPRELTGLIAQSRRFTVASGGAFDVTVAPLVDLFRGRAPGSEPSERDIAAARSLVACGAIAVSGRRITLTRRGMAITLDGIAKGAIVDAIARVLERHQVVRWLINAGGDIRGAGAGDGDGPWTVAIRDPATETTLPEAIALRSGALATSGCYDRARAAECEPRDIVHGALGAFPRDCASVTVNAPSAMAADALATTVFALGPRAGPALIERLRCACLIVLPDGGRLTSSKWKELTS